MATMTEDELARAQEKQSKLYYAAKARYDPDAMQAAHEKMNQVRRENGLPTQDASEDIQNVRSEIAPYSSEDTSGAASDDYTDYVSDMYRGKLNASLSALESAYRSSLAGLDAAEKQIPEAYRAARNQAAGASGQGKQNFAEYAAASGLNSGAGGQAELARSVALQSGLHSIGRDEASALAGVELQRVRLANEYRSAIAAAKAEGSYELASALYRESVRKDEALLNSAQLQHIWDSDDFIRKLQLAQYLSQYGDFSGFRALGVDTAKMEETYAKATGRS